MGDDHGKTQQLPAKPSAVVTFVTRLCAVAWFGVLFGEVLPRGFVKHACILLGSHAAVLAFVTAVLFWLVRRQALLFLLVIASAPPVAYFAVVIRNVAKARGWIG